MVDRPNAWHVPDDWNGVDWSFYLVPCPNSLQYKAALRGAALLLCEAHNWDENTGDIVEPLKAFSLAVECMQVIDDILQSIVTNQEDMVEQLTRIADNLETSDGEGGIVDIATILFDILPVLLAQADASELLAGSASDIEVWLEGSFGAGADGRVSELVNALQLTSGSGCCEPNPTVNGMVFLPPGCFDYAGHDQINAEQGVTFTPNPDGTITLECLSNPAILTLQYPSTAGKLILKYDAELVNNDSGDFELWVKPADGSGWDTLIDASASVDGVIELTDYQQPLLLRFMVNGVGDVWEIGGAICQTITDYSKPTVVIDTAAGIGSIEGGNFMKSAEAWVMDAFDPAVIRAEINESVANVEIDWTRTFDGTVTVETYDGATLVNDYEFDASLQRRTTVDFLSDTWDTLKVEIVANAAQALADVVVWAFGD